MHMDEPIAGSDVNAADSTRDAEGARYLNDASLRPLNPHRVATYL